MTPEAAHTAAYLESKLAAAEKALQFYATERHWWTVRAGLLCVVGRRSDCEYGPLADVNEDRHQIAATALAAIRGTT